MAVGANFIMSSEVVVAEFVGPMIIVGSNAYDMGVVNMTLKRTQES